MSIGLTCKTEKELKSQQYCEGLRIEEKLQPKAYITCARMNMNQGVQHEEISGNFTGEIHRPTLQLSSKSMMQKHQKSNALSKQDAVSYARVDFSIMD
ncbi:hypothetical protein D5086_009059 [Populus alba]|uniref:Uncharacterized protein n=1 Tax=Populus alba TaxID=43335 RepID=A0ACC4CHM9_POPAL